MSKSGRMRLSDVRGIFRLLGECRELGGRWETWHSHVLGGLCPLIGARVAMGAEWRGFKSPSAITIIGEGGDRPAPIGRDGTLDSLGRHVHGGYLRACLLRRLEGSLASWTRRQLMDDVEWYGSACFNENHKPAGVDSLLHSLLRRPTVGTIDWIVLHRALGEPEFSTRERRLVRLFHDELGRLIGTALASADDPDPGRRLSPRLQQTLECLLEGDSEKRAASRLGLSRLTVHEYVKVLYRHFGVGTRAELLALFFNRSRRGR